MRLANKAFLIVLTILAMVIAAAAQTTTTTTDARPEKDPRNTAPTVGTGGPPGGPTGLFTVYDGQTLRRGEFTFSIAYSNFDRDPGDADITEVPISFQIGLTNNFELFFNTDAYRAVKINSPGNLSSFYLPNSQLRIGNVLAVPGAIVLGQGAQAGLPTFRLRQPFVQYPFVGGVTFPFVRTGTTIGTPVGGGEGAANFPGLGSVYGSILPGIVLQTATVGTGVNAVTVPTVFTTAPSYLPDAPFINRTYGESAFNTMTVGAKWRFTGVNNPYGIGIIPFYRFYMDNASDFSGFNQMQRGASPGAGRIFGEGGRGDVGLIVFADARFRSWLNISANVGYIYNSSVKGDFGSEDVTILDRGDELIAALAVDFPVNKYFQPILEFRSLQYVGGRTPNNFENDPMDGLAGVRIFPARWVGFGFAYRHHFNQQDRDSFEDSTFSTTTTVIGGTTTTTSFTGVPPGFRTSTDPHGFIIQGFVGRRDKRAIELINQPANVTAVTLGSTTITLPCPPGQVSRSGQCPDNNFTTTVSTTAVDPENDVLTYSYTVSAGRIVGQGANVTWDLSGVRAGTYTITAGVDDGCGICGQTQTQTITVVDCPDCAVPEEPCVCPTVTVTEPASPVEPGQTMTFTANVSGGTQDSVTYNWTVDQGTIVSGQGTPVITVDTTGLGRTTIRATVEVGGDLCPTCPTITASGTGIVDFEEIRSRQIDEFTRLSNDDVRQRIDNLFIELQNDPNATGYVINYGPPREVTRRETLIRNHIRLRRYPANRVVFIQGGTEPEIRTTLWVVPAGATPPTP